MNNTRLLTALALIGWLCVGAWSVEKLLEPSFLLDILRLFTLC
jgi:hypothetical protein